MFSLGRGDSHKSAIAAAVQTSPAASKSSSANSSNNNNNSSTSSNNNNSSSSADTPKDSNQKDADTEANKYTRFENEGVIFKAKLIGSELVMEPRGDKMCQNSIQRLKAIIKGTNSHKKRIVLKISYDGVKVYDEKTSEILYHHEVSQISYIASDDTDSRTFGYVSDVPSKTHQFICFKTTGPAIQVMSVISSLFEAVLEKNAGSGMTGNGASTKQSEAIECKQSDSADLIFDLFAGLPDPIIVDKGDSMISYNSSGIGIPQQTPPSANAAFNLSGSSNASLGGIMNSSHNSVTGLTMGTPVPPVSQPLPVRQRPVSNSRPIIQRQSTLVQGAKPPGGIGGGVAGFPTSASAGNLMAQNDRYAVFNDIDNLPSIFEAVSQSASATTSMMAMAAPGASSSANHSAMAAANAAASQSMDTFRRINPFDDDFFA